MEDDPEVTQGVVSKNTLWNSYVNEAGGFYNLIITVASAFLGGSMIFIQNIATTPTCCSLFFLFLGWFCLVGSIWLTTAVRRQNVATLREALEEKWDDEKADQLNETRTDYMVVLFGLGLLFIVLFGLINLVVRYR
jgi:hypothetical protein